GAEYTSHAGVPGSGFLDVQEPKPMGRKAEGPVPGRDVQYPEQYEPAAPVAPHLRRNRQTVLDHRNAHGSDYQHLSSDSVWAETPLLRRIGVRALWERIRFVLFQTRPGA